GGNGNDLALDDITFRAAGPAMTTSVSGYSGSTIVLCENDRNTLHLNASVEKCFVTAVYQWQISTDGGNSWSNIAGATGLTYDRAPTSQGYYLYRITVAESSNANTTTCRVASMPVAVSMVRIPDPAVTITSDHPYRCVGSDAIFT